MSEKNKDHQDENEEKGYSWEDDDNFGLPEVEFDPINREEEKEETTSSEFSFQHDEPSLDDDSDPDDYQVDYPGDDENFDNGDNGDIMKEKKGRGGLILFIIVLIIIGGGSAGYFYYYKPMMDQKGYDENIALGENALQSNLYEEAIEAFRKAKEFKPDESFPDEQIAKAESAREALEQKKADEEAQAEADRKAQEALRAQSAKQAGVVEVLSGRTGKFYIVVASNIDEDLARDYADKLSKNGETAVVIPAYKKGAYTKVTVGGAFDSASTAQSQADQIKGQYTNAWVIKY